MPPSSTGRSATRPTTPARSFATFDQLGTLQYGSPVMHVTGDRTVEHGLATIGYDDEGVADPELGHRPRRRAGRLPARPGDGAHDARAERRPLQRLRVRRLPRPHPDPADGQRLAAAAPPTGPSTDELIGRVERGIYVVGDKSWSHRHAALQLPVHRAALLPDRERPARRAAARRRLPGHDHRLLELDGGGRRPADLGARRRVQLRQGPARARWRRSPTAARRRCSATSTS